jgi:N-acetylmuramoyl-L-alanine amidase
MYWEASTSKVNSPLSWGNSPLAKAEQGAQAQSDSVAVGAAIQPCSNLSQEKKKVIEVIVLDEDGADVDGVDLLITRADHHALTGKTDPTGTYRFKGLDAGSYQLSLDQLDQSAWLVDSIVPLPDDKGTCNGAADWQSPLPSAAASNQIHSATRGECMSKIAMHYGFLPETIWDHPANAELKQKRHDHMHILCEEDKVVIPARRSVAVAVAAGDRVTLRRLGVPRRLRIRFLYFDDTPRVAVHYLLSLTTNRHTPQADIDGVTDEQGFVDQAVPPDTVQATITLHPGTWPEIHTFTIGSTYPIDEIYGWQTRLNNLGYDCAAEYKHMGPLTHAAICDFQQARNLPQTGEMDESTKAALLAMALS